MITTKWITTVASNGGTMETVEETGDEAFVATAIDVGNPSYRIVLGSGVVYRGSRWSST